MQRTVYVCFRQETLLHRFWNIEIFVLQIASEVGAGLHRHGNRFRHCCAAKWWPLLMSSIAPQSETK